ncbi:CRISPR-associated endonuclease Cas4/Cas1 [Oceanibacterium hippocampi]|uniref:CRISPR-associated endonuclease Cas1 n=1 Tax=Oceanibacterium hippocampi TaxID=745714 RepID=A0A1Y5U012_9PROT|nr:CRISPR-associated endonuclease Cas4/Cas1 [Oceanibacterium hippocampi]SLN77785.1 CRISPR-associated protein Cas4/endonuclease Cas1 fusion [Oceanibacterium hippocampi]
MSDPEQFELRLPAPPVVGEAPLIPVRMVNEFVYCPRLAYLMWTQGEWAETADTVEGRRVHNRVDRPGPPLPPPDSIPTGNEEGDERERIVSRSLTLSSQSLGIIGKLDIAEAENGTVTPVDYKRGKRPHIGQGAHEPERVQVCLQGLLLEENGYAVAEGAIYYAESRERVRIELDEELRATAREAISRLRLTVTQGRIPPPLEDSPKCPRCALVAVCLPDEIRALAGSSFAPRTIAVPADEALPLIVQSQRARIGKQGETLKITEEDGAETRVRLIDVSELALYGNASITTPALSALLEREIPVTFHSHGGWFKGIAHGIGHRNVEVRTAQYRLSFDATACLRFARDLVAAKIANQRTMLRRNWRGEADERRQALERLSASRKAVGRASGTSELLGLEGDAAATYFRALAGLLRTPDDSTELAAFRFDTRNRRPPTDPVNAMLSLAYAMLARHLTVALTTVGLDPYRGFYHGPRYGRPALALDLMEPFRPIIADSVVLTAINNGELGPGDFVSGATGTALGPVGRRRFVAAFERRMAQETTHPLFGYRVSMRRLLLVQARPLTRFLLGEFPSYPHYLPR